MHLQRSAGAHAKQVISTENELYMHAVSCPSSCPVKNTATSLCIINYPPGAFPDFSQL
jgi:hypothetical protein